MACRAALCRVNATSVNRTDRHMIQPTNAGLSAAKMRISAHARTKAKAPGAAWGSGKNVHLARVDWKHAQLAA
jgi:hypothetical protein